MKKILTAAVAAVMGFSSLCVHAEIAGETVNPRVFVDDREVYFADQKPIIDASVNRTMVPLRGVFEAMGAGVNWDGEKRSIRIDSKDNLTRLILEIDNKVMDVWTAVSLMKYDIANYELETAPVIMNNRTMIPLRAISENMAADVDWDGENHIVTIHTKEYKKYMAKKTEENKGDKEDYTYSLKDNVLNASISADKEAVSAGEQVTVSVNISNTAVLDGAEFNGISAAVYYDSSKFSYDKAELIVNGEVYENMIGATNEKFMNDAVKSAMVIMPKAEGEEGIKLTDAAYLRYTFTSLKGEEGEFILSDRKTDRGYDTGLLLTVGEKRKMYEDYQSLYIDTTPLVIAAK